MFSIGVTADRNALPDTAMYAACMASAFQELRATRLSSLVNNPQPAWATARWTK
jgi:hypothetical protein